MKEYYLIQDVPSLSKAGIVYGRAGDKVKLITSHGDLIIVESVTGDRYSTLATNISSKIIEIIPAEPATPKEEPTRKTSKPAATRKKNQNTQNQQSIF